MKSVKCFLLFLSIVSWQSSFAFIVPFGFFKTQADKLVYTTAAQSIYAENCSGITTVQHQSATGVAKNVTSNLTISLTPIANLTFYSDNTCNTPITDLIITTGTSSASFYFISTTTGTKTIAGTTSSFAISQDQTVSTNPYIWTGGGGNATWSTAGNWSGGAAPGASHIALFNGTCASNCSPNIAANLSVAGVRMATGYSGTITQNAGVTLTIGTSGWVQNVGIFVGSDASITYNGPFYLAAGTTFTATSASMTVRHDFTISGNPTFNHQSATVVVNNSAGVSRLISIGTTALYNVTFGGFSTDATINGSMVVNGTLTFADTYSDSSRIDSGTILASGDVTYSNYGAKGTALIKLVGSTNQTLTSVSAAYVPPTEIASTGGTVALSGTISMRGSFTYTSGAVNTGTSTIRFISPGSTTPDYIFTPGSVNYYNVSFEGFGGAVVIVGSVKAYGTVTFGNTYSGYGLVNSGTILAYGNVVASLYGSRGTVLLKIVGSTDQTITGSINAYIPDLEIASTGGTVTFVGLIRLLTNFALTSGTVDAGTSTLIFGRSEHPVTASITPGSAVYNNVSYEGSSSTYTLSGSMIVNGTLSLKSSWSGSSTFNGGEIIANKDVEFLLYGLRFGTTAIKMSGGTPATLTQTNSTSYIPLNFSINKTAGVAVTLASAVSMMQNTHSLAVTSGNVDMAGYGLTIKTGLTLNGNTLTKNGGVLTVNTVVLGSGALNGGTIAP